MTLKNFRKTLCVLTALLLVLCSMASLAADPAVKTDERMEWSLEWLENALSGQVDESALSEALSQALEAQGGLTVILEGLKASAGTVQSYGEPMGSEQQGMYVTVVPVVFESMTLQATLVTDEECKLAGLLFQPEAEAAEVPLPEGATAEEVTVDAGVGFPLSGTLVVPATAEGKLPAALLVWGSGANDRDETAGANRVFAKLASGLAERGIITLRFDKRTHTYPDASVADPAFSIQEEYIQDVVAAVELLKADPRVDASKIYLIGHSQGAMLAPRLVSEGADVAGMVLMAGSPRDLTDILFDQEMNTLQGIDAPEQKGQYEAWRSEAQEVFALDAEAAKAHEPLYSGTFGAYYLWDMHQHDAISLIKELGVPTLIMQGENDWQVYADVDYAAYQEALQDVEFVQFQLYEDLNHLFMPSMAKGLSEAMLEYNTPGEIPGAVLDDLAGFVKGQ